MTQPMNKVTKKYAVYKIGDETAFCMNGRVNTQNVRKYAPRGNSPSLNSEKNDSRAKLTIWIVEMDS